MADNLRPLRMSDVIFETLDGNLKRNLGTADEEI